MQIDHPYVMRVYDYFIMEDYFYIVCENCSGGDMFDDIVKGKGYFSEEKAAQTMIQIFAALHYCHTKNIVHRDLKPENLVYYDNDKNAILKLIDFGLS